MRVVTIGLSMCAFLTMGLLVPIASAHYGIPAHHTVGAPGGAAVFDLPPAWCLPPGGARAQTHAGFNVDELNWHAVNHADGGTGLIAVDQFGAVVPVYTTGAPPASTGASVEVADAEVQVTSLTPSHTHHYGANSAADAPGMPIADHPALFDAIAGFQLAPTPINPFAGTGVDGSSMSSGDVDPGHLPACDASHPSPLPQSPTGAGVATAFDTSVALTPPGLVFGCIDIGDNDFETGIGGGFFMIDAAPDVTGEGETGLVNIVLGLLSTGPVDLLDCATPAGFVSVGGYFLRVLYADALLPPTNGAPYTVCYDGDDNGICTTNVAATNDAWDQCKAEGDAMAVAAAISSPLWGSATTPTNLGPQYIPVAGGVSFFGRSTDGSGMCTPKKAGALGVLTAAGPGNTLAQAPSVAALEAATGDPTIDFTYLVVFTSVCAEVTDPADDCGLPLVNAGFATGGWLHVV